MKTKSLRNAEQLIKIAGYHGNTEKMLRVWTSNRISYSRAKMYYNLGQQAKQKGQPCSCSKCNSN